MPKEFKFVNNAALRAYRDLPKETQSDFGNDLNAIQQGKRPFSDFEDISGSVGPGAIELKENGSPAYRVVYCAKYLETVYILHAFTKTTNGVDRAAMATAKLRYQEMKVDIATREKELKESTNRSTTTKKKRH